MMLMMLLVMCNVVMLVRFLLMMWIISFVCSSISGM